MHSLLDHPVLYNLKSMICSFGRRSVRDYLRRTVSLREGVRVLDVGCGPGRHAETLEGRYFGVDLNRTYATYGTHNYAGRFSVMDAGALAFPDETFDFVFCVGLLHHLPDSTAAGVVEEMKRCTVRGGAVCVIEAVIPAFPNIPGQALFALDRGRHRRNVGALGVLLAVHGFHCREPHLPASFPYDRACFWWEKP